MELKKALIDVCVKCNKTRKNGDWERRNLKGLLQDARVAGFEIEFRDSVCPDCSLPVPIKYAPMEVFHYAHL